MDTRNARCLRRPARRRPRSAGLPVAIGLALVAVGSIPAGAAASAPGKIDACKLLTAAEAGKIFGTSVTVKPIDTSAAGPDAASMCDYGTGEIGGGFMLLAGRDAYTDAKSEVANREKEAVSDLPPGIPTPTFEGVDGLGEAAYLAETPESLELHVLDHGVVVVVTMNRKPDASAVKLAEAVGGVALGNLRRAGLR